MDLNPYETFEPMQMSPSSRKLFLGEAPANTALAMSSLLYLADGVLITLLKGSISRCKISRDISHP
jgi:hypothetical protein